MLVFRILVLMNAAIILWNMSSLKHSDMEKKAKINWVYVKSAIISENHFKKCIQICVNARLG